MVSSSGKQEVRFTVEMREPTPAQAEAGERLFGKLTTRACASLISASAAVNKKQEVSDEQDAGGELRWPSS